MAWRPLTRGCVRKWKASTALATARIRIIEEKQGLKCRQPEASLWEILPILRCVKLSRGPLVKFLLLGILSAAGTIINLPYNYFDVCWKLHKMEFVRIPVCMAIQTVEQTVAVWGPVFYASQGVGLLLSTSDASYPDSPTVPDETQVELPPMLRNGKKRKQCSSDKTPIHIHQ